ncbi:hypothetical protein PSN45_003945 [Yamadazyma tenuis]|uniref:Uncharacterized protein n=1 Tax=Candida tenuis (strain ATCC 10573 / BCRC 21748 / CBS 615 / JCM 9827 / NBRC 10315 / NRRL Y-1498 / VKM Y-70) TaxID=590646 RepID=G3B4L5_CANTC|nr:uncharacterized protein CANTEDRAFT_134550 [Yamadazyma tenuis ATCC 10573]EGV63977.1 hypothetical protein CANTEDRAFT_134550 [Yamadazyma tenuis ATCC 10573]WEJ96406.1 hypothetical protein PSN45_003945 [Yamadazyma tenuis]
MSLVTSFDIRKFSKLVLWDTPPPDDIDASQMAVNSWFHYPQRSALSVTFIQAKDYVTMFVYHRGSRLERVKLELGDANCCFVERYPSVGFKQTRDSGRVIKRFQVGFAKASEFKGCVEQIKKLGLNIRRLGEGRVSLIGTTYLSSQMDYPVDEDFANSTWNLESQESSITSQDFQASMGTQESHQVSMIPTWNGRQVSQVDSQRDPRGSVIPTWKGTEYNHSKVHNSQRRPLMTQKSQIRASVTQESQRRASMVPTWDNSNPHRRVSMLNETQTKASEISAMEFHTQTETQSNDSMFSSFGKVSQTSAEGCSQPTKSKGHRESGMFYNVYPSQIAPDNQVLLTPECSFVDTVDISGLKSGMYSSIPLETIKHTEQNSSNYLNMLSADDENLKTLIAELLRNETFMDFVKRMDKVMSNE